MRLNSDLSAELERIINKCLEKDRHLRYQHASEIRTDLQRLKRDTDVARIAVPNTTAAVQTRPRWHRKTFLAAGGLALAALLD